MSIRVVPFWHLSENVTKTTPSPNCSCDVMKDNGIKPVIEQGGGGMDANRFNSKGIKSVGAVTGYMNNHSTKEELYIDDLNKSAEVVYSLICVYSEKSLADKSAF